MIIFKSERIGYIDGGVMEGAIYNLTDEIKMQLQKCSTYVVKNIIFIIKLAVINLNMINRTFKPKTSSEVSRGAYGN